MGGASFSSLTEDSTSSVPLYDPNYAKDNPDKTWLEILDYYSEYCEDNYTAVTGEKKGIGIGAAKMRRRVCQDWAENKNRAGTNPALNGSCLKDLLNWIKEEIEYNIFGGSPPSTKPSTICFIAGGFALMNVIAVILGIFYFGSSILDQFEFLFKTVFGFTGSFVRWSEDITGRIASFISSSETSLLIGFKYFFDLALIVSNWIIDNTQVNYNLLELNVLTFFVWMGTIVLKDIIIFEEDFEDSAVKKIYRIFDWPFRSVRQVVEWLTEGKGLIYWVTWFFLLPFDCGSMVVSLVVYGVLYLIEQLLEVITNKSKPTNSHFNLKKNKK